MIQSENFRLDGARIVKRVPLKITETIYDQAALMLFVMQDPDGQADSREQIDLLMAQIQEGHRLPPIIVEQDPELEQVAILDGNHRIMALYEQGVPIHEAIYVKRRVY